ncbi:hypothetical protein C8A01DRAFT_40809 [Parachaetomium inaequale]|uniref:Uncharacterized protein n=1 Tax=Parachaetomium inaequale TaxID=2588326 RepID=A0AAN6P6P0_9PEZI|nr:hypothetical protein C8A01DRAFT_40809 [Parachaetomium inaequale]
MTKKKAARANAAKKKANANAKTNAPKATGTHFTPAPLSGPVPESLAAEASEASNAHLDAFQRRMIKQLRVLAAGALSRRLPESDGRNSGNPAMTADELRRRVKTRILELEETSNQMAALHKKLEPKGRVHIDELKQLVDAIPLKFQSFPEICEALRARELEKGEDAGDKERAKYREAQAEVPDGDIDKNRIMDVDVAPPVTEVSAPAAAGSNPPMNPLFLPPTTTTTPAQLPKSLAAIPGSREMFASLNAGMDALERGLAERRNILAALDLQGNSVASDRSSYHGKVTSTAEELARRVEDSLVTLEEISSRRAASGNKLGHGELNSNNIRKGTQLYVLLAALFSGEMVEQEFGARLRDMDKDDE